MKRKPHIQAHYNTGDKRIKEAAERAWLEMNGIQKMQLSEEFDICKAFGYPVKLMSVDESGFMPVFDIKNLPKYKTTSNNFDAIINAIQYLEKRNYKDLPFDNLGI